MSAHSSPCPDERAIVGASDASSARRWTVLHGAFVLVLLLCSGAAVHLWVDYRHAVERAGFSLSILVNSVDQHISGSVRAVDNLLLDVAHNVQQKNHTNPVFAQNLLARLATFPEIRYVGVVTADGILQSGTWPDIRVPSTGLDVSDRRYFTRQKSASGPDRLMFGQPVVGRVSGERTVHVSRPLRGADGRFLGVVIAALNPDIYAQFLDRVVSGDIQSAAIFTADAQFIARTPGHDKAFGLDASDLLLFRSALQQAQAGVHRIIGKADNIPKLQGYRALASYPLVVTAGMPDSVALASWYRLLLIEGSLLLAACASILVLAGKANQRQLSLLRYQADLEQTIASRTSSLQQANQDLAATMTRLHLILDSAGEGIYGIDQNNRVTFVNQTALTLLGWSEADHVVGLKGEEVLQHTLNNGQSCRHGLCSIRQTLEDGQVRRVADEFFRGPNGTQIPVEYVVAPHQENGEMRGAVVVFRDIGHLKDTLQTLEQRQSQMQSLTRELERSNHELEHFAYVASHDLREPLRMVSSYLALLDRRLQDRLGDDEREFIGFALDGAKRMDHMILDLLDYSRIGRINAVMEPVDLNESVQRVMMTLAAAIREQQGKITVERPLPVIQGYASQIDRLVQNLISNSLKYHAVDQKPEIHIAGGQNDDGMWLCIADKGQGIAPEDQERAFEIFQRLAPHTDQHGGTGIGLAACRKIMEQHHGKISLESAVDQGARFTMTFPVAVRPV